MEINSPLVNDQSDDLSTSIEPPPSLYVSDPNAQFPLILECDDKSDKADEYDLCMVFDVEKGTTNLPQHAINFCRKMVDNGLDIYLFYGIQKLHVFVLIRANFDLLRETADEVEYTMTLDPDRLQVIIEKGDKEAGIAGATIPHEPAESFLKPYEYISAKYRSELDEELYWRPDGMSHPFRSSVRTKLSLILVDKKPKVGVNIRVRYQVNKGKIASFFPLHDSRRLQVLHDEWLDRKVMPWKQPLFKVKEYFGEKIGLYFQFMSHYTYWLIIPAVVAVPLQIYLLAVDDFSNPAQIAYSIFLVLWAIIMLEFWKRREKFTALQWGMIGFEDSEITRPEFRGTKKKSFIDGKESLQFPSRRRYRLMWQSNLVIWSLIAVVIGVVISIYLVRNALSKEMGSSAQTVASILNAAQIQIFNFLFQFLAAVLTNRENHRTDTQYEDAMIAKLFLFQFVNSYASFFYIGFIAKYQPSQPDAQDNWQGDCGAKNCMRPLATNLGIIFLSRMTIGNVTEIGIPYALNYYRSYNVTKYAKDEKNSKVLRPEQEFQMTQYDSIRAALIDYADVAISFGYIALFACSLPIAATAAFIANWIEVKTDAYKLMYIFQKPVPRGAEDIGLWQDIFTILAGVSCITNAALTVFTMDVFDDKSDMFRMWFFILFQWGCFTIQLILMALVPDEPAEIHIQLARQEFMTEKAVLKIPDDTLGLGDDIDGVGSGDKVGKEFDIHTYHKDEGSVRATFRSNYRLSNA